MSSTWGRKFRYIIDRAVNAYWMLRNGKFKLIFESIVVEIQCRIDSIRDLLSREVVLDDSQVPASAYVDKRKVLPPSYRPTKSQAPLATPLKADCAVVTLELKAILSAFTIEESDNQ